MNKRVFIQSLSLLCIATNSGCGITPINYDGIRRLSNDDVCISYGVYVRANQPNRIAAYRDEINARKLLSVEQWARVSKLRPDVGDPICTAFAALGIPTSTRELATVAGSEFQHGYYDQLNPSPSYFYSRDSVITAIQR